jgi:hypothetical protein
MVVREARDEIVANPLPASRGPVGCFGALGGLVLLGVWPTLRGVVPVGDFVSPFVVLAGIMLVGGGLVSTLFVGRRTRAADAAVEAALRQLEEDETGPGEPAASRDREVDLRAATLLVSHAFVSDGPTTARTFDPDQVAVRVEARLPLVLAVQSVLSDELGAWVPFGPESDSEGDENQTHA